MTLTEAYNRALTLSDESIQNASMLHGFNACQNENADLIYYVKKPTTITKASEIFTLPSDYVSELTIITPSVDETLTRIYGSEFQFEGYADVDECEIMYRASLPEITTTGDAVLPLPLHLHEIYPLYVAKMYMLQDDEPGRYQIIAGEYERMKRLLKRYYDGVRRIYKGGFSWRVVR